MKNKVTIISRLSVFAVVLALAGSALAQDPTPKATASPEATADDAKVEKTKEKKSTEEKATPKTGKSKGDSSLSMRDKDFMKDVAKAGMMEVEWGKWASEKGEHAEVKKFGSRMVTDHSKANNELMSLASKKGVKLPEHKSHGKWKSDKDYMDMMVKDHEKVLAEFQGEANEGTDPDVKKWAGKTSKVIEKHLAQAKQIQSKLK